MKKTPFLSYILAAVIACSSFAHAIKVEHATLAGNDYRQVSDYAYIFTFYVTGLNNWLEPYYDPVTVLFGNPTKIVDGELRLEKKVSIAPLASSEAKWEMGANSRLALGGSAASLDWFNITGQSVVFDDGVLNLPENQSYTLGGNVGGTARVCLKDKSWLNLNGKTLSNPVYLSGAPSIGNGTVSGNLTLQNGASFTWSSNDLNISGTVILEDNSQLDLNGKTQAIAVTLNGSATVGNGTQNGTLEVKAGKTLTLGGDLGGTGTISLANDAALNLNGKKLTKDFVWSGNFGIGNGTIDKALVMKDGQTLTLCGDLDGTGGITLGNKGTLNLGGKTLFKSVSSTGDATIGNGTQNGALEVKAGKTLTLGGDLNGTGGVTLANNARLNLNNHTLDKAVTMEGSATMGGGTYNGSLAVKDRQTLTLGGGLKGADNITLGSETTLNLNGQTLTKGVELTGNATISNGAIDSTLVMKAGSTLTLSGDLKGAESIILGSETTLKLNEHTLDKAVTVEGSATMGGGTYQGSLSVAAGQTLTLSSSLSGQGVINLADGAELDLCGKTLSPDISVVRNSIIIGYGTIQGNLLLEDGVSYTWANKDVQLAGSAILGADSRLDLDGHTVNAAILTEGSAGIENGTVSGTLTLASGVSYTWGGCNNLLINGPVTLEDGAVLNLGGKTVTHDIAVVMNATLAGEGMFNGNVEVRGGTGRLALQGVMLGDDATISMGDRAQLDLCGAEVELGKLRFTDKLAVADNGTLTVAGGETFTLDGNLAGTATVALGDKAVLALGGKTLSNSVTLAGDATMGGGAHGGSLTVKDGNTLTLGGDLSNTGEISGMGQIILGDSSVLNLNNHTLGKAVSLQGSATIGGGTLNGAISVGAGKTLTLGTDMSGADSVILENGAALNLGGHTLDKDVTLKGTANLAAGTIGGHLTLANGASCTWTDNTLQLTGGVTLNANSKFDLGGKTINVATLAAGSAVIDNGTVSGNLILANGVSYTWNGSSNLQVTGTVTLGDRTTLNLGGATLANDVIVQGATTLASGTLGGGGTTITGDTIVKTGADKLDLKATVALKRLEVRQGAATVTGTAAAKGGIASIQVAAGSTLELVHTDASWGNGQAYQGNLVIGDGSTVTASGGDGWAYRTNNSLTVKTGGKLDMGAHRWTITAINKITLAGGEITGQNENGHISFDFCGGANVVAVTEDSTLSAAVRVRAQGSDSLAFDVAEGKELAFSGGIVSLGQFDDSKATVYKRGAGTVVMSGANGMTNGTIIVEAGTLKVSGGANPLGSGTVKVLGGATLTLDGEVAGTGNIILGDQAVQGGIAVLDLGGHTLDRAVILDGSAAIGNGTLNGNLILTEGASWTWGSGNDLFIKGTVTMEDQATLNLGGNTVGIARLRFTGQSAVVDNGTLAVAGGETLTLGVNLTGTGGISLGDGSTLNLGAHTLGMAVALEGSATINGGTQNGALSVAAGQTLTLGGALSGTGDISLKDGSTLNLGAHTLDKAVAVDGNATVSGGTQNGALTVGGGNTLKLGGNLAGSGAVTLKGGAALNLGTHTLDKDVALEGSASFGGGVFNRALDLGGGNTLTLCGDLSGEGAISLGNTDALKLNGYKLDKAIILNGSASVGGGTLNGTLTVGEGKKLTLNGDLTGTGSIILDGSALNLSFHQLDKAVTVKGTASIVDGTLNGDLTLADGAQFSWADNKNLQLNGNVTMGADTVLYLYGHTVKNVTLTAGSADILTGTVSGNLALADGVSFTWSADDLQLAGTVTLGANSRMDLGGKTINGATLNANNSTITNGTVSGDLVLAGGGSYTWSDNTLKFTGGVTLGADAKLDLGGKTINAATLAAGAGIDNGTVSGSFTLADGAAFTWSSNSLHITGTVTLGDKAVLNLGGHTLDKGATLNGDATIGGGTLNGAFTMGAGTTLTLSGDLAGAGSISLGNATTLDLAGKALSKGVVVDGAATITGGTLNGSLEVKNEETLTLGGNLQGTAAIATDNGTVKLGEHAWTMTKATPEGAKELYTMQGKGASGAISGHAKADAAGLAGASEEDRAKVQGVNLTTRGDFTFADTDICDSLIDLGKGTTMTLKNVNIQAGSRFTDDTASIVMVNTRAELKQDVNTIVTGQETAQNAIELKLCGDATKSITLAAGSRVTNLTCGMFDSVTMDGGDLWLDMTDIAGRGTLEGLDYFTLTFDNLELANGVQQALVNVKNMSVSVTLDGTTYATTAYFNPAELQGDYAPRLFFMVPEGPEPAPIPEPATSTLSLLALAALAARRRKL